MEIDDKAEGFLAFRALGEADKVAHFAYTAALSLNDTLAGPVEDAAFTETLRRIAADLALHWTLGTEFFERLTKAHILAIMRVLHVGNKHSGDRKARLADRMAA